MNEPGLREIKKEATAQALAKAAYELAVERGMDGFVIDDVVSRAGYSRRTFANYFSCKEEAVASVLYHRAGHVADLLADIPVDTPLVDVAHLLLRRQMNPDMLEAVGNLAPLVPHCPSLEPFVLATVGHFYRETVAAVMEFTEGRYSAQLVHTLFVMAYGSLALLFGEARHTALPGGAHAGGSDSALVDRFLETTFVYLRNGFAD